MISTINLHLTIAKISAFIKLVEIALLLKYCLIWIITVFAICLIRVRCDATVLVMILLCVIFFSTTLIFLKEYLYESVLTKNEATSDREAEILLNTAYNYIQSTDDHKDEILKMVFLRHIRQCSNTECPCQKKLKLITNESSEATSIDSQYLSRDEETQLLNKTTRNRVLIEVLMEKYNKKLESRLL